METETFRDRIATADEKGKRLWIYPKKPRGRLYKARTLVAWLLLAFFFTAPFLKMSGHPLVLLNFSERHFVFFGTVFGPQDFYLLVLAVLSFLVFVVLFTAVFGRLFCGWICPQTIFMEMVFRKIEYLVDGNSAEQKKLNRAVWSVNKIFRRFLKHGIFLGLSFIACSFFLAYITGIEQTIEVVLQSPWNNPAGFTAVIILSFLFYGVFARFREQVCTIVCPYGRLQSVLVDSNSIVVAYDYNRGEPRVKLKADSIIDRGDCIDCFACVKICPTGIDIRNGTQLECVNCTACIDACNEIMRKTKRPKGLIRYTSEKRLEGDKKYRLTGRIIIYGVVLALLLTLLIGLSSGRNEVEAIILRASGSTYYEGENNSVRNLYTARLTNKTPKELTPDLMLKKPDTGTLSIIGGSIILKPEETTESAFLVEIENDRLQATSTLIIIEVISDGKVLESVTTTFIAPGKDR